MGFALAEFASLCDFCRREKGTAPVPRKIEVTKIDVLVEGKHWTTIDDAYAMLPAMTSARAVMAAPRLEIAMQLQEDIDGVILTTSISPARLKADRNISVFQVEFQARQSASAQLPEQLTRMNEILNDAFGRFIPDAYRRFA